MNVRYCKKILKHLKTLTTSCLRKNKTHRDTACDRGAEWTCYIFKITDVKSETRA